jgi:hypothetical protein
VTVAASFVECRNGHTLTDPDSVLVLANGWRRCRECKRDSDRRNRATRKERNNPTPNPVPMRPHAYRDWAVATWQTMTDRERYVVAHALGYMTLEQAVS